MKSIISSRVAPEVEAFRSQLGGACMCAWLWGRESPDEWYVGKWKKYGKAIVTIKAILRHAQVSSKSVDRHHHATNPTHMWSWAFFSTKKIFNHFPLIQIQILSEILVCGKAEGRQKEFFWDSKIPSTRTSHETNHNYIDATATHSQPIALSFFDIESVFIQHRTIILMTMTTIDDD